MARTAFTVQDAVLAGITPTFSAVDQPNGNQLNYDPTLVIEVKNANAGACTVTIRANGLKVGGVTIPDATVSVPATTGDRIIGPFDPTVFQQAGGLLYVDFSVGASVTMAAYRQI